MKCVICKTGQTQSGKTTVTLEQNGAVLVVREVPAEVCQNCGEVYLPEEVARALARLAAQTLKKGVVVDVREFNATMAM
ncbi:type II toxin-antitoxin system MqsA family antitoxin [Rhodothermus marinus]|uniref:type II toxin-antitoxin system MqsA family antitoxin n=1 Tax=Rhodothermus marinus TaxID=29549 RepID=UPI0037CAE397